MTARAQDLLADLSKGVRDSDSALFSHLVRSALEISGVSNADFAREMGVSRPAFARWLSGKTMPHRAMRAVVLRALVRHVERTVREADAALQRGLVSAKEDIASGRELVNHDFTKYVDDDD